MTHSLCDLVKISTGSDPPYLVEKRLERARTVRHPLSLSRAFSADTHSPNEALFIQPGRDPNNVASPLPDRKTALATAHGVLFPIPFVRI